MKNTAHSARQFVFCCVSTLLTALLAVLTFLRPERLPLAPLLVAMLLRPTLLLVTAGVNFSCLKMGVRALFSGKPDRHTAAVLTVLLALVLCTLGVCPDAPVTAALLLTASAWLDLLEQRLEAGLPDAPPTRMAEAGLGGLRRRSLRGGSLGRAWRRDRCCAYAGAVCAGRIGDLPVPRDRASGGPPRHIPDARPGCVRAGS